MNWFLTSALVAAMAVVGAYAACEPGTQVGPCLCMEDAMMNLALECSNVTNGSEITMVLEEIQVASVSSLDIKDSPELLNMPDDAFGDTAIEHIRFQNTGLSSLTASVFAGPTSQSLLSLYLKYEPNFTSLSSELVAGLPMLEELYVSSTGITALTDPLPATALRYIDFTRNEIEQIADDYFADAPELSVVLLAFNGLTSEALADSTQSFAAPNQDLYLDLGYNSFSYGLDGVSFPVAAPRELILSGNGISNLTEGAYSGLLDMMTEQYAGLDPYILMDNNPLVCGCEVSWLVSHPNRAVVQAAQCSNGQLVDNLGPADFTEC